MTHRDESKPTNRSASPPPWRLLAGILLSIGLLLVAFWQTDPVQLWENLARANLRLLLGALLLNFLGLVLRAKRWSVLFPPDVQFTYSDFLDSINLGYLVNNISPARLGDLVRSLLLGQWIEVRASLALSTTILERVLDGALILLLFFGLLPLLDLPSGTALVAVALALVIASSLAIMSLAIRHEGKVEGWARRILDRMDFLSTDTWADRIMGLVRGFNALRQRRALVSFVLWSLVVWVQTLAAYWLTLKAISPGLGLEIAALAMAASSLGLALPSAPAGLGAFEAAVVGALVLVEVPADAARSIALALHGVPFVSILAAGMWSLTRRGLGYRYLLRAAEGGSLGEEQLGEPPES